MELSDKAVLITGGKRIGAAIATELAARGMHVALAYNRSRAEAESVAKRDRGVRAARGAARRRTCRRRRVVGALVEQAVSSLGRLDVLVNMASVYSVVPFEATDEAVWSSVVERRSSGGVSLRARGGAAHALRGRQDGSSTSPTGSRQAVVPGTRDISPTTSPRKAVIGLTEALALELASSDILVNAIAPGPILPPTGSTSEETAAVEAATPVGRWGGEIEIAKAVRLLPRIGLHDRRDHPGGRRTSRPLNTLATEP